jgi:hypothetical protein
VRRQLQAQWHKVCVVSCWFPWMQTHACACKHAYAYANMRMHMQTCICMQTCVCKHAYAYANMRERTEVGISTEYPCVLWH